MRCSILPGWVVNGGCRRRDGPEYSTVQRYFYAWRDDGKLERINFELLLQAREAAGARRARRPG
jgi:putative transposase